jgi:hypothetical protein
VILKVLLVLATTLDHIGSYLFPQLLILRLLGRLAFPLACHALNVGLVRTTDRRKYIIRLLITGLAAQPFYWIQGIPDLNFVLTLALFAILIESAEKNVYYVSAAVLVFILFYPVQYGIYGLLVFLAIRTTLNTMQLTLTISAASYIFYGLLQSFSAIAIPLIHKYGHQHSTIKLRNLFYFYYPAHLYIILALMIIRQA